MGTNPIETAATHEARAENARRAVALFSLWVIRLLLLLGIGLRIWAYARETSLYLDEVLLSHSILDLPLRQLLTGPLLLDQVAPRGFLLIERLAVMMFGPTEKALRLLPFVCAIASLVLFWRLAQRVLPATGTAIAVFLFVIGVPFIRFGAEVKQYECDLLVAIALPLLLLKLCDGSHSTARLVIAGLVGFFVIWFSQASVLVMAGLGTAVLVESLVSPGRRINKILLTTVPLWACSAVLAVIIGLRSMTPSTRQFMNEFWSGAFLPLPFGWRSVLWIGQRFTESFSDATLLRYRWPLVFVLLAAGGLVVLWRRNRLAALMLCGPPLVGLAAACAHQYPWRGRLAFWILPGAVLAVAVGIEWIRNKATALHPAAGGLVLIAAMAAPTTALAEAPPPYDIEHHLEMLRYLQQHRQPGDVIYIMQLQQVGANFYASRYGLQPNDWFTGICDPDDARAYLRDVDRFRGVRRLWVLRGSGRPLRAVHAAVLKYLQTMGTRQDAQTFPSLTLGSVSIELYDLSDSTRLLSTTADQFPVPAMPRDPKIGCREWTKPGFDWGFKH